MEITKLNVIFKWFIPLIANTRIAFDAGKSRGALKAVAAIFAIAPVDSIDTVLAYLLRYI